jgi:hypothetical protein
VAPPFGTLDGEVTMDTYKITEKAAAKIADSLSHIGVNTDILANMLSKQPGIIQYRIWKIIRALIRYWKIDAQYLQYDPQYVEIYKWAERIEDD